MQLKKIRAVFTAELSINMDDIEALEYLSRPGFPVDAWICEKYHITGNVNKQKIRDTLMKINRVLNPMLKKHEEVTALNIDVE